MIKIYKYNIDKSWNTPCEKIEIEIDSYEIIKILREVFGRKE